MKFVDIFLTNPLVKVFPDQRPTSDFSYNQKLLQGELFACQLVYCSHNNRDYGTKLPAQVTITGLPVALSQVELVPSQLPTWPNYDDDYLRTTPGLFPDLLRPSDGKIGLFQEQYRSLWLKLNTQNLAPGTHSFKITVREQLTGAQEIIFEQEIILTVLPQQMRPLAIKHTEWLYVDTLAQYYQVPAYSEAGWQIIANYLNFASQHCAINTILTPIFNPPLDVAVGHQRLNVQLLSITYQNGQFSFDFAKVKRWCQLCQAAGITTLEIPPLFTQWGAKATPNIYLADGEQIFGWDVPATSPLYRQFLSQLISELVATLTAAGYGPDHLLFHIADEPSADNAASYRQAVQQVTDLLADYQVIDALSDYQFYADGLVKHPVVANDSIQTFIDHQVPDLWTYYCCAQTNEVPNRFFAEPSYRNRVMGVLLYIYQIKGFLHWGYNFYNTALSTAAINPFLTTDAGGFFPSGDPFLVYPGENGQPLSSLRNEVQLLAWQDLRLLKTAETVVGRGQVLAIISELAGQLPTFSDYPRNNFWFDQLHVRLINVISQAAN